MSVAGETDAVLADRARAGDVRAYGELVVRFQDRIYNACRRICGHHEDARDLTQETFLRAYRSLERFEHKSAFGTWLFRIAMNLAFSHRKKPALRLVRSLDDGAEGRGGSAADRIVDARRGRPSDAAEVKEARCRVSEALESLDEHHRAVLVLRDIEGFDYERIAEILDIARGTVKSRVFRARAALKEVLERTGAGITEADDDKDRSKQLG